MSIRKSFGDNVSSRLSRSYKSQSSKNTNAKRPCFCQCCKSENKNASEEVSINCGKQFTVTVESPTKIVPCILSVSSEAHYITNGELPKKVYKTTYSCCCCSNSNTDSGKPFIPVLLNKSGEDNFVGKIEFQENSIPEPQGPCCCLNSIEERPLERKHEQFDISTLSASSGIEEERSKEIASYSTSRSYKSRLKNHERDTFPFDIARFGSKDKLCYHSQTDSYSPQSFVGQESFIEEEEPKRSSTYSQPESFEVSIKSTFNSQVTPRKNTFSSQTGSFDPQLSDQRKDSSVSKASSLRTRFLVQGARHSCQSAIAEEKPGENSTYSQSVLLMTQATDRKNDPFQRITEIKPRQNSAYSKTESFRPQSVQGRRLPQSVSEEKSSRPSTYSQSVSRRTQFTDRKTDLFQSISDVKPRQNSSYSKTESFRPQSVQERRLTQNASDKERPSRPTTYSQSISLRTQSTDRNKNFLQRVSDVKPRQNSAYSKTESFRPQSVQERRLSQDVSEKEKSSRPSTYPQSVSLRTQSTDQKKDLLQRVSDIKSRQNSAYSKTESLRPRSVQERRLLQDISEEGRPSRPSTYSQSVSLRTQSTDRKKDLLQTVSDAKSRQSSADSKTKSFRPQSVQGKRLPQDLLEEERPSRPSNYFRSVSLRTQSTDRKHDAEVKSRQNSAYSKIGSFRSQSTVQGRLPQDVSEEEKSKRPSASSHSVSLKRFPENVSEEEKSKRPSSYSHSVSRKRFSENVSEEEKSKRPSYSRTGSFRSQSIGQVKRCFQNVIKGEKPGRKLFHSTGELFQIPSVNQETADKVDLERLCCKCCCCSDNTECNRCTGKTSRIQHIEEITATDKAKDSEKDVVDCFGSKSDGILICSKEKQILYSSQHDKMKSTYEGRKMKLYDIRDKSADSEGSRNETINENEIYCTSLGRSTEENGNEVELSEAYTTKPDINDVPYVESNQIDDSKRSCLCTCCPNKEEINDNVRAHQISANDKQIDSRNFKRPCFCCCCPCLYTCCLTRRLNSFAEPFEMSHSYRSDVGDNKRRCLCACCPTTPNLNRLSLPYNFNNSTRTCCCLRCIKSTNKNNIEFMKALPKSSKSIKISNSTSRTKTRSNKTIKSGSSSRYTNSESKENIKSRNSSRQRKSQKQKSGVSNIKGNKKSTKKSLKSHTRNYSKSRKVSSKRKKKKKNTKVDNSSNSESSRSSTSYESQPFENSNNHGHFKRPCYCIGCPCLYSYYRGLFDSRLNNVVKSIDGRSEKSLHSQYTNKGIINNNDDYQISRCCVCCSNTSNNHNKNSSRITFPEEEVENLLSITNTISKEDNTKDHDLKRPCCCVHCPKFYSASETDLSSEIIKGSRDDAFEQEEALSIKSTDSVKSPKPGQGLLAYSLRLSTFCKRVDSKEEMLLEVPKNGKLLPNERPENHKLSFVDDPPYSNAIELHHSGSSANTSSCNEHDNNYKEIISCYDLQCCQCCKCQHQTDESVKSNRFYIYNLSTRPLRKFSGNNVKYAKVWAKSSIDVSGTSNYKISKSQSDYVYCRHNLPQWIISHPTRKR